MQTLDQCLVEMTATRSMYPRRNRAVNKELFGGSTRTGSPAWNANAPPFIHELLELLVKRKV
jgi:hypothetical protein